MTTTFEAITQQIDNPYQRVATPSRKSILDDFKQQDIFTPQDLNNTAPFTYGLPGVAIFDADRDGELDFYVTNGPGAANSLYSNQLQETRQLAFIDVADQAGVAATGQDSSGVSYGDIDNDGDQDLLVLGAGEANRLFENQGNGQFVDITASSDRPLSSNGTETCAKAETLFMRGFQNAIF